MSSSSLNPRIPGLRDSVPGAAYKKGDVIGGKYQVRGVLGEGGFGTVYLVTFAAEEHLIPAALKTFKSEFLTDVRTRERFRREARMWIDLADGPCIVRAFWVDEADGRLFVVTEYVPKDEDGLNSLADHLRHRAPDLAQSLRWAIQVCYGMEYAYSKGIRCHRDIKPDNIMISPDKWVKITDFGLAGVIGEIRAAADLRQGHLGLSVTGSCPVGGTPEYMPPEQFRDSGLCDQRSDIYSFGIVLFQMVAGGRLPYSAAARTFAAWYKVHAEAAMPALRSPLASVVSRCLQKEQDARFVSFRELRAEMEPILKHLTGEEFHLQEQDELSAGELTNRGLSLHRLGCLEEALGCFSAALSTVPRLADALLNAANTLISMDRFAEAIPFCDRVLAHDPLDADAMNNKGLSYHGLGAYEKAVECFDRALAVNIDDADFWYNRGRSLRAEGLRDEAERSFSKALDLNPGHSQAWLEMGNVAEAVGRPADALRHYDKSIAADPLNASAWTNRGVALHGLGQTDKALEALDRAVEVAPDYALAWYNKGYYLFCSASFEEAAACFARATNCDERLAPAWSYKGAASLKLGDFDDAATSFARAISLDPTEANSWIGRAAAEDARKHVGCAILCYNEVARLADATSTRELAHATSRRDILESYCKDMTESQWAKTFMLSDGAHLLDCGFCAEAAGRFDSVLRLEPHEPMALYGKAVAEDDLGRPAQALNLYRAFLAHAQPAHGEQIQYARERLRELEGG